MTPPQLTGFGRSTTAWLSSLKGAIDTLLRPLIATSILVTGGILAVRYLGLMEATELAAYDQMIQLQPESEMDDRLLVVGITEGDVRQLQGWPIRDIFLADALEKLTRYQPQTIAIDLFRDFPNEPGHQQFLDQLQTNSNTLTICKVSTANDMGTAPPAGVAPEQVGFADLVIDPGGILRRSLLMAGPPERAVEFEKEHTCNQPNQTLLSLSFRAALRYLEAQGIEADFTADNQLILGDTVIPQLQPQTGGYQQADSKGYQIMLSYRSKRHAVPVVSLMDLLRDQVNPDLIRDRIVFIGYITPQARDDFYTPYSISQDDQQKMPGVIVHAQSASQLISTVLDGRPLIWVWPVATEIFWIFLWSLLGGISGWYLRHPASFAVVVLAGCGSLYAICFLMFTQGGWIPLIPANFTFIVTAVGVVLLDRFNRSDYGQQVYRKVKTFLRLEIDIDEVKVEQQVSEITETDYFRSLSDRVKVLRQEPTQRGAATQSGWLQSQPMSSWPHSADADIPAPNTETPDTGQGRPSPSTLPIEPRTVSPFESYPPAADGANGLFNASAAPTHQNYELAFLNDLHHKARYLKQNSTTQPEHQAPHPAQRASSKISSRLVRAGSSDYPACVPFVLDPNFCRWTDTTLETKQHLAYLAQQLSVLRHQLQVASADNLKPREESATNEPEAPFAEGGD